MQVNLGGFDIAVPEELLDRADVSPFLEQVCGEGMAQDVWSNPFLEATGFGSAMDGLLECPGADMVPPDESGPRILLWIYSREKPLPLQLASCIGKLAFERSRKENAWKTCFAVGFELSLQTLHMPAKERNRAFREGGDAILVAFPGSNMKVAPINIDVLNPKPNQFHNAQTAPVGEFCH